MTVTKITTGVYRINVNHPLYDWIQTAGVNPAACFDISRNIASYRGNIVCHVKRFTHDGLRGMIDNGDNLKDVMSWDKAVTVFGADVMSALINN